ncbi:MAG: hypothetical protein ABW321_24645 [Polyangiales bacterium]
MDEDLKRWAAAWQTQETQDMQLWSRARKVYRTESILGTVLVVGWLVAAISLTIGVTQRDLHLTQPLWHSVFAGGALVVGLVMLARERRVAARTRAQLVETPLGLVTDLISAHERELYGWTGRVPLGITIALALGALGVATQQGLQSVADGVPVLSAWSRLVVAALALCVIACAGVMRARYLRRELGVLRELQNQL